MENREIYNLPRSEVEGCVVHGTLYQESLKKAIYITKLGLRLCDIKCMCSGLHGQHMPPAGGMPLCSSRATSIKLNATSDFCFRYRYITSIES